MFTRFIGALSIAAVAFAAGALWAGKPERPVLESRIFSASEARTSKGEWGEINIYTEDATPTSGTQSMLTASLTFLPGKQLQPLKAGDLMYTKP